MNTNSRADRVQQVVADCIHRRNNGEQVSDEALCAAHPDLLPGLAQALRHLRLVEIACAQPRPAADRDSLTPRAAAGADPPSRPTPGISGRGAGALQVRCPHCHNTIEIADDAPLTEILCSACGSSFSLLQDTYTTPTVKSIGHFELVERLGTGGFGTVWKARDTQLDRTVAIKIPRQGRLASAELEQLFFREARAAAQLKHPGIVSVHEVGRQEDTIYIVSDLVRGASLSEWVSAGQPTARESAELCAKVADALDHAHQAGVVHRDLKPSNIMIDLDGAPHIMDFGLARREAGEVTVTVDGQMVGTPAYMSPEQARGEAHQADRRSDVYSLGVILYQLLTGELPFRGQSRMLVVQILRDEPPKPRTLNSRIPRDLQTIALKCLEKEPARRYTTAADLAADLRRFLRGEPIVARPIGRLARSWRWCRRNPVVAALITAVAASLFMGTIVSTHFGVRASAVANQRRHELYVSDMNVAFDAWNSGSTGRVLALLNRHRPGPREEDLRRFEWYYLWRQCQPSLRAPTFHHSGKHNSLSAGVAFSPDGKHLAFAGDDHTVEVWDWAWRTRTRSYRGHNDTVTDVAFSPQGGLLASGSADATIRLWDTATSSEVRTLTAHEDIVSSVAFSSDGKKLASASHDSTVKLWDTATGKEVHTFHGHTGEVYDVEITRDGTLLASGGQDQTLRLWDAATGTARGEPLIHEDWVYRVAFSPDAQVLVSTSGPPSSKLFLWDVATLRPVAAWNTPLTSHALAFSPDGQRLAAGGIGNVVALWDLKTGHRLQTIKGHSNTVAALAFSPDGSNLASASCDETVKLWEVGAVAEPAMEHADDVFGVAFSPDGETVASVSADGTAKLWNARTNRLRHAIKIHSMSLSCVAFSPDGLVVATGENGEVRLWDAASGQPRGTIPAGDQGEEISGLAFSPDGRFLATGSTESALRVWRVETAEEVFACRGHKRWVRGVAYSPDGKWLASACWDTTVRIWDATDGALAHTLTGHSRFATTVAFSPDGRTLASGSWDHTVRLWNVATGEQLKLLEGHVQDVNSVAFSPDGRTLASTGLDGTVRLWDPTTGELRGTITTGHDRSIWSVAFSPDGNTLATGSVDNTIKLFRAATPDEVRAAEAGAAGIRNPPSADNTQSDGQLFTPGSGTP